MPWQALLSLQAHVHCLAKLAGMDPDEFFRATEPGGGAAPAEALPQLTWWRRYGEWVKIGLVLAIVLFLILIRRR